MFKHRCHTKRRYKKLAAALASAAFLSAAVVPGMAAVIHAAPPPAPAAAPAASQRLRPQVEKSAPSEENAEKVLDITATAYAPGPHDNDQWGNKTYLGTQVRPGVIAVDPRVIPLGAHVLIKYPDGSKQYAVAEDTGGAIKGNRIDVAKWTVGEARNFGMKPVKVYVLKDDQTVHAAGGL